MDAASLSGIAPEIVLSASDTSGKICNRAQLVEMNILRTGQGSWFICACQGHSRPPEIILGA
jgi:hypothetical protein